MSQVCSPQKSRACSIQDLDDFVLGRIFSLAGQGAGAAIVSTCRRWQDLYLAEPSIWRDVSYTMTGLPEVAVQAKAEGVLRTIKRVGPLVERFELSGEGIDAVAPAHVEALLGLLPFTQLRALRFGGRLTDWAAFIMGDFKQLHELDWQELCSDASEWPEEVTADDWSTRHSLMSSVRDMTALRELRLITWRLPHLYFAAPVPAQLTQLCVDSHLPLPDLQHLTVLASLRQLQLRQELPAETGLVPPDLAALPALTLLELSTPVVQLPGIELHSVKAIRVEVEGGSASVTLDGGALGTWYGDRIPMIPLRDPDALAAALAGLQLPAVQQLSALSLRHCRLTPEAVHGCAALAATTRLCFDGCCGLSDGFAGALAALLPCAPQLLHLDVSRCWLPAIPLALPAAQLRHLRLACCGLQTAPETLHLPEVTCLDLSHNPSLAPPLPLCRLLAGSRGLRELRLWGTPAEADAVAGRALLGLRRLSLAELGPESSAAAVALAVRGVSTGDTCCICAESDDEL